MAEVMTAQYIRTARLKGLSFGAVVLKHALRNALIVEVEHHFFVDHHVAAPGLGFDGAQLMHEGAVVLKERRIAERRLELTFHQRLMDEDLTGQHGIDRPEVHAPLWNDHEAVQRDALERLGVADRCLDAHLVRNRRDGPVALEALRGEPPTHVLLVEALRLFALRQPFLVRAGEPEPRRVGRVDLVDDHDPALLVFAHLVFGIDQDQPALAAVLLAFREQGSRDLRRSVEVARRDLPHREDLLEVDLDLGLLVEGAVELAIGEVADDAVHPLAEQPLAGLLERELELRSVLRLVLREEPREPVHGLLEPLELLAGLLLLDPGQVGRLRSIIAARGKGGGLEHEEARGERISAWHGSPYGWVPSRA